jgi:hypothetical protein
VDLESRNTIHRTLKFQGGGKEMKKFVVLSLFGLLIMAFSATVYAQKLDFKASGMIDFDTTLNTNVPFYFGQVGTAHAVHGGIFNTWITPSFNAAGHPSNNLNHTTAYSYARGLLKFDAVMDKNLSGTIYFELDAFRFGGGASATGGGVGSAGGTLTIGSERNTFGVWSTDRAAVEVKNVYIDVGLPYFGIPVPMTVRVGAQPFGVRPRILVYTDGAGITGGIDLNPVTIIPMWAKVTEGVDWAADDADLYGLHANVKLGTMTIGGYGLYYNMNTYPLAYPTGVNWATSMVGAMPLLAGAAPTFVTSSSYGLYAAGTQKADMWWFGFYADGKAGPVNLSFDFVYDYGKVKEKLFDLGAPNVKYRGWASRLNVDFPWEKFNFGATGMYASGADADKTSKGGVAGDPVAQPYLGAAPFNKLSTKVGSYVVPPGSETSPGANESIVMYSCFNAAADGGTGIANTGSYYQVSRGGFGGTWFAKLYGSAKLVPWYKVTLQGLYIGDTTKNGNTFGTARVNPFASSSTQILRNDKRIGWELDLINELQIYKNLTWFIGAGYLWAGPALDVLNPSFTLGGVTMPGTNFSPKNPWNVTTRLIYTF